MKFLLQDFVLNAFYSYERQPNEVPKMKLLKLAAILGVNYRTASVEIRDIENQIIDQAGKLLGIAEDMVQKKDITSRKDIPGITQMLKDF